jgi:hypothetical protein
VQHLERDGIKAGLFERGGGQLDFMASGMPSVFSLAGLDSLMDMFPEEDIGQLGLHQGWGNSVDYRDVEY